LKTKVPPPAYRRIQDFPTKVCVHFYCFIVLFNVFEHLFCFFYFLCIFAFQVGVRRTRPNTKPKVHTGIDLMFANMPENLRVLGIFTSSSDVP
jgi:hypothetical protein